eukprot:759566-Hanusia_phi.AAC.2
MDPETRRHMWNYISLIAKKRAVILTTHSMEEADALCSQIGIMIQGHLRAQGTSQELKSRFGSGYQVYVRFRSDEVARELEEVQKQLRTLSEGLITDQSSPKIFRFAIPRSDLRLGDLFRLLVTLKEEYGIEDFRSLACYAPAPAIKSRPSSLHKPRSKTCSCTSPACNPRIRSVLPEPTQL